MSNLSDHIQRVFQAIIDQEKQAELLPGRNIRLAGGSFMTLCPFHEEKTPSFSLGKNKPVYHCFSAKCGAKGNWIDLIMAHDNLEFGAALERLERIAGVSPLKQDARAAERYRAARRKTDILTAAQDFFIECLKTDEKTQHYLKRRGYTQADIDAAGLGAFPGAQATIDHLTAKGFDSGEIYGPAKSMRENPGGALCWIYFKRDDYKLMIPYFDATRGAVIAIMGRLTRTLKDGEKEQDKYKPISDMEGVKKENLYNIDQARGRGMLIVEGLLDSAIATARGIPAAALGGSDLLDGQLNQAIRYGAEFINLCLDNDAAGIDGTKAAIKKIWKADKRAYVVTLPDGIKDPDELIRAQGIDAFKAVINKKELSPRWIIRQIIQENPGADIYQLLDTIKPITITADPVDLNEIQKTIRETLDMPESVLNEFAQMQKDIDAGKRIKIETSQMIRKAQELINDGDPGAAVDLLAEQTKNLKIKTAQYESPFYSFNQYLEDERHEPAGLKTGYKSLDEILLIPSGAITIIAARPMHGKTTFLLNLMRNHIDQDQNKSFFFFSYEQPKKQLMRRLLLRESGHVIDHNLNYIKFGQYLKLGGDFHAKIETAKTNLTDLIQSERLALIDRPFYIDELAGILSSLAGHYSIGAVYIDYIQKIKIKGRYQHRQAEIQAISAQILETAISLKIPIILGAQVNRTVLSEEALTAETMREAGDIEQDANIILGLWNKSKGANDDQNTGADKAELSIKVIKNRDGKTTPPDGSIQLTFDQPILKISEPDKKECY